MSHFPFGSRLARPIVAVTLLVGFGVAQGQQPYVVSRQVAVKQQHQFQPKPKIEPAPAVVAPTPTPVSPVAPVAPIYDTYPSSLANTQLDAVVDQFGMSSRECTSYVAYKVQQTFGNMPNWTTYEPNPAPNANRWPSLAQAAGIATGSVPKVHSVAISGVGQYGHAMWVEAVLGNYIKVSQYNVGGTGSFSTDVLPTAGLTYIYFGG